MGMGIGFSFPFRRSPDLRGDALNFIWSPSIDGRFYIRNWLALMLQFRGIFGEKAFVTRTDQPTNPTGSNVPEVDPEVETPRARSLVTLFGVVFQF
jgi:hypothetical protein